MQAWLMGICVLALFLATFLAGGKDAVLIIVREWSKARTVFTFMFYAAFIYMILKHSLVPPELNTIISTLFGFWFGQRQSVKKEGQ
jgi:cell shape-determining protein MreD